MHSPVFPHVAFQGHALLDCGGGEKLERFADVVVRRPDPQAMWPRGLGEEDWRRADLSFAPDAKSGGRGGHWVLGKDAREGSSVSESWRLRFGRGSFIVRPTPFKHLGIFPEQSTNWDLVARAARGFGEEKPRLLNLFGYTGAASVLAVQAGFEVTHVDASKTSIAWARENLVASGLPADAMRIVLDDALAFAQREARRGARYHAVLLDPPHYGRGPKGETWQFEDSIGALVAAVRDLVADRALVVLSSYAIGCSPITLQNLLADLGGADLESGELALPEVGARARLLPAGFCARWSRRVEFARDGGPAAGGGMKRSRPGSETPEGLLVLHCDNHLLAVSKPAGIPTVPDSSRDESLLDQAKAWVRKEFSKPGNVFLGVVQRLDRPVSGVLLFARTSKAAARLSQSLREGAVEKIYWGVAAGEPRERSGIVEQWLEKDEVRNVVRAFGGPRPGAKRAVTHWRVLATRSGNTLYEFAPETGRAHQLRVCAASLGTPLLGDLKYGAREALPDASVALHARGLAIDHPTRGDRLRIQAPPPAILIWDFGRSDS